jgi:hypothetical protein
VSPGEVSAEEYVIRQCAAYPLYQPVMVPVRNGQANSRSAGRLWLISAVSDLASPYSDGDVSHHPGGAGEQRWAVKTHPAVSLDQLRLVALLPTALVFPFDCSMMPRMLTVSKPAVCHLGQRSIR